MALLDQAGKAAADEVIAQLPAIEAFFDAQLAKIQATIKDTVAEALTTIQATVGASLADVTAERTEAVNDIHGIIDRLSGMSLQIPARKAIE